MSESSRLTLGFGIDEERGVLAVFDGWTKRATGGSSSVHIKRETLEGAVDTGFAEQAPLWDSRAAVRLPSVEPLLLLDRPPAGSATERPCTPRNSTSTAGRADHVRPVGRRARRLVAAEDQLMITDATGVQFVDPSIWEVDDVSSQ